MARTTRSSSVSTPDLVDELQNFFTSSGFLTTLKNAVREVIQEDSFQFLVKNVVDTAVAEAIVPLNGRLAELELLKERVAALEPLENKVVVLNKKNAELKDQFGGVSKNLELAMAKSNENEQYSRKYNLRFVGIDESESENCLEIIINFCKDKLNLEIAADSIDRAHRVGKKQDEGKPRPIIVKFLNYNAKMVVIRAKKALHGSDFYINEDLTRMNLMLFKFARFNAGRVKSTWVTDGKILVRDLNEKTYRVTSMCDFESLNLM